MVRGVDLFCGAGGFSAGLLNAGIDIVAAYDNWPLAIKTYNKNLPSHAAELDIGDIAVSVDEIASHNPDIIIGGPPCQDFSTAGNRVEGKHANLTVAFSHIVAQCAPSFVLMENVTRGRSSAAYAFMRSTLEQQGYSFAEIILDASRCGVPQSRKRFFVLGTLEGDGICSAFLSWIEKSVSGNLLTVSEYMGEEIDVDYYYRHARNYSRRAIFTTREPSPTIRGVNRPIPPHYVRNHLDSADPSEVRPLYSWERSRIQTFPSEWQWSGKDRNTNTESLIGNAVPVNLARFVGQGVLYATS